MSAISGDTPGALAISEVARLTGLTSATVRVWQRRYGLGASRVSPGGHRRYSRQDVARLRAVQQLVARGLPTAEAVRVVLAPAEHGLDLPPDAHPVSHLLTSAALDLDGPSCRSLLRDVTQTHSAERTWEDVVRPVLAAVGALWSEIPHGIAVEHVLSHVAAVALGDAAPDPPGPSRVLLACVPAEPHDLPLVALSAALAQRGVATTLTGAATPADTLAHAVRHSSPEIVMLLALQPELADPSVFGALPPTGCLVAAGPGWDAVGVPGGVVRVNDLPGALGLAEEVLEPPDPRTKGRRRSGREG